MMSMASALTNHWVAACSSCRGYTSNRSDGCFKVLSCNHKGKHFLPTEKVASTAWQITRAAPKDPKKGIDTKWWEKDMKSNMKNIRSQEDFDEQLPMAGDKFTVVHFFSPSCGACKALHSKVHQFAGMHPENCNFLWSTIMNKEKFARSSMFMSCHCSAFTKALKDVSIASAAQFQLFISSKML
ncbi:hypothetical protein HU200_025751 [Digitaria exilis]|uniref:Thioredoxin domain-containing protein n=1 Tax=Digitaria exilis TaxID=1010633 RepID=A0A835C018_9POAL|nr:hypothetical protein HU200_025751 [Digitaria exilis]